MDWFKMQTVWGASVERFSDAEAGRFIKALFAYVRHGEEYDGNNGREDPIIWQALETLRKDVESFKTAEANRQAQEQAIKEKRRQAAQARWNMQKEANESKCKQTEANESKCTICNADAPQKENIEIIKETPLKGSKEKRARFSPPTVDEVAAYCKERGNKIDPQRFVDFYAAKGWKVGQTPMKDWKACVRTWEQRDSGQPAQGPRILRAQQYEQRDYKEKALRDQLGVDDFWGEVAR